MAIRAFDPHKPPDEGLIDDCVHCGFCLPTCPTYVLWGEEMDSPRGRIALMKRGLQEGSEMSPTLVQHFDRCLGCMACVTACPSGVQYDRLIEATRPQVERNHRRSSSERIFRSFVFATFMRPGVLRVLAPLLWLGAKSGITRSAETAGLLKRTPRLAMLNRLAPGVPPAAALRRLPEVTPARGRRRATVGLLQGCVQRVFFGDVNHATIRVLAAEGFEVLAPRRPRCCGALALHAGEEERMLSLAKATIEAFEGCEQVAGNAAGCGSAMRDYAHLLADDPAWAQRAAEFSDKVRDVCELLAEHEPIAERGELPLKVAYHDACHLAHAQGVRAQPRALLSGIPSLELVEPPEWEICCGSAGVYNLMQPEAARALGERKARNLLTTGAQAIAAGNPGCALQIGAHLQDLGRGMPIYHPMQLLDMSIAKGRR